jgi:MarR family transcriptional regulator for hemolysin
MDYNLKESTSTLIKKTSHLYIRLANKYLKEVGVPHAYTLFLLQLWQEDGQSQSMLHKKIGIEQPTAVRTLDRMERDKFIQRKKSLEDRRVIKIMLTKKSKALEAQVLVYAKKINDAALDGLDAAERKKLNKLLRIVVANLSDTLDV